MRAIIPVVFFTGALAGAAVVWFCLPDGGSSSPGRRLTGTVPPTESSRAPGRNAVVAAKSAEDAFLQSAAVRDFGPGGPQLADFQELLFRQPSMQRTIAFANLLSQLSPENAKAVIALIGGSANLYDLHREHELAWVRWGEIDGRAACAAIFVGDRRFGRTELSERTIRSWAMRDPQAAREWLMGQEDIPLRHGMMRGVLDGFAAVDPAGAERFIAEEITDESLKTHGLWRVARSHLAEGGLPAVQAYFAEFDKSDPQYEPMRVTVGDMFVDAGSTETLRWLGTLDESGRAAMTGYLTSRLVNEKPDNLVIALANGDTPPEVPRGQLLSQAVRNWAGANPNAMGEWLRINRNTPHYDEVVEPYVKQIRSVDPEAAAAWSATVKDPALRARLQAEGTSPP